MTDFKTIQKKWQNKWEQSKIFEVKESSKKKKFYCLEMFPYPSGSGLHMGHAFNYTIGDIYARFKRMQGFNVLYPMGYDSLGLPAENAAIKANIHPKEYTETAVRNYIRQQKELGLSYDWTRMVKTHDPDYYKWDQWIFLKMFEKNLAYRKKAPVNWCPKCNSVLANEQVHNGKCWRHKETDVQIGHLEQWFFKITKYAEELYDDIDNLTGWPEEIKAMQKNWIGKSYGAEIKFTINGIDWPIFTTRPDTIYGVTFMVVSAQHPQLMSLVTKEQKKEVETFLKKIKSTSEKDFTDLEKEGAFTGSYAINPINNAKVPVYTGNFVVADYGAGMVMAVPAHDQRDFEFAKKYNIPIKVVIQPRNCELNAEKMSKAFTFDGILINSKDFDGMNNREAINEIPKFLEKKKLGKKVTNYKLRDWLISRQRYWGTPIPIIYCDNCGIVPVPEKDLPVKLPENVKFGEGNPLLTSKEFVETKCPKCKGKARRETDTMDTFVNSSWYFLRYTDTHNDKKIFDEKKAKYWLPIDLYIGGAEHACMHLIYFRFYTKFLRDLKLLNFNEPAVKLFNQGMVHGSDGAVMSKSRGNVVLPEEVSDKYGIDTARLFLMSQSTPNKDTLWSDKGIEGSFKFINRVMNYFGNFKEGKTSLRIENKLHKTIRDMTDDIENIKYNLAIIKLRMLFDAIEEETISKSDASIFLQLLSPICPHVAEEYWEKLGNKSFISTSSWPEHNPKKINEKIEYIENLTYDTKKDILHVLELAKIPNPKEIELIVSESWKYSLFSKMKEIIDGQTRNPADIIKQLMQTDLKRYGQEIIKIVPRFVDKLPEQILSQKEELSAFEEIKKQLEEEFKCKFKIVKAEDSKEPKGKLAIPGRPTIILK
jgi:leucyl-tRNA synthetase